MEDEDNVLGLTQHFRNLELENSACALFLRISNTILRILQKVLHNICHKIVKTKLVLFIFSALSRTHNYFHFVCVGDHGAKCDNVEF